MSGEATSVLWRRLAYMLTPQLDIYASLRRVTKGKNVLEIGFGTGIGVLQYAATAARVVALEIDPSAVAFARKMMPVDGVDWEQEDILHPTHKYLGFDVVLMIEVLEHVADRPRALAFAHAALNPGGFGIITVPNANRYRRRAEPLNAEEWTPDEALRMVRPWFPRAVLLGADLEARKREVEAAGWTLSWDTDRETPIVIGVERA